MLLDGRRVSPVGAAMAGAATIDSFDGHDGHVLTKGHAGAAVLPGLLAFADAAERPIPGGDFLAALVVGYEVAIRAGIATHRSSPDYHTSGSWNALGVVAASTRLLGLDGAADFGDADAGTTPRERCRPRPVRVRLGRGDAHLAEYLCGQAILDHL